DLAQAFAGPATSMYLADQGAEVIKVEPPTGDTTRRTRSQTSYSRPFLAVNRNKRSIAIDLRQDDGRAILYDLVRRADVLVHNGRPGVAERLKYDYPTVQPMNERLIYAWVNGWGTEGAYGTQRGADFPVQGMSGILSRQRSPDGSPLRAGLWVADMSAPMVLSYGIALALLMRGQTGRGQMVTTSLLHAALAMQTVNLVHLERGLPDSERLGYGDPERFNWSYPCRDGGYLAILFTTNDEWAGVCRAIARPELVSDPRFEAPPARNVNGMELYQELRAAFARFPRAAILSKLQAENVMCAPVNEWEEVFEEPQAVANGYFLETPHPAAGRVRSVAPAVRLSSGATAVPRRAPYLGEHTRDILAELGYDEAAIDRLAASKVVRAGSPGEN
ncbi:MAG: CoA transferase, partial [Chloroflexota bacterium]